MGARYPREGAEDVADEEDNDDEEVADDDDDVLGVSLDFWQNPLISR